MRVCIDVPGGTPVLANLFWWSRSASKYVPPENSGVEEISMTLGSRTVPCIRWRPLPVKYLISFVHMGRNTSTAIGVVDRYGQQKMYNL